MAAAGWDDYYCRVHDEWNQTLGKYVKGLQKLGKLEIRMVTGDVAERRSDDEAG